APHIVSKDSFGPRTRQSSQSPCILFVIVRWDHSRHPNDFVIATCDASSPRLLSVVLSNSTPLPARIEGAPAGVFSSAPSTSVRMLENRENARLRPARKTPLTPASALRISVRDHEIRS